MPLTKLDLKQIIQEEMQKILQEDMPVRGKYAGDTDEYNPFVQTARPPAYPPPFRGVPDDPTTPEDERDSFNELGPPARGSVKDPLETTLWPIPGDPVYTEFGNLPSAMYGEWGTGPWPLEWATKFDRGPHAWGTPMRGAEGKEVPFIPGLSPEDTAAYYEQFEVPHTPYVGKESPVDENKSNLKEIIKEEYDSLLKELYYNPHEEGYDEGDIARTVDVSSYDVDGPAPPGVSPEQWKMVSKAEPAVQGDEI